MTNRTTYLLLMIILIASCCCSLLVIVVKTSELLRLWKRNAFVLFEKPPSDQEHGLFPLQKNEVSSN